MVCRNSTQCVAIANVLNIVDISSYDLQHIATNCNIAVFCTIRTAIRTLCPDTASKNRELSEPGHDSQKGI